MILVLYSIEDTFFVDIPIKGDDEEIDESEVTPMMWGYGFNWLSMTVMMLGSTLWIVFLVVLVWALVRWLNNRTPSPIRQTNALRETNLTAREIIHQRYARGEIDATTFDQMRERFEASDDAHQQSRAGVREPLPL